MNDTIRKIVEEQSQTIQELQNQLAETSLKLDKLQETLEKTEEELNYYKSLFSGEIDPVKELNDLITEVKEKQVEYKTLITELRLIKKNIK